MEHHRRVKLRLKATPGDYIYLELPKGFGPAGMPGLEDGWKSVLLLPQPSAEITFLQPGNMLTLAVPGNSPSLQPASTSSIGALPVYAMNSFHSPPTAGM